MELRPEGMETWGVKEILKETKRLVFKEPKRRLFLPFYLAFFLPGSLLNFLLLVLLRSTAPSLFPLSIFFTIYDQGGQQVPFYIVTDAIMNIVAVVVPILMTLGVAGVMYIIAYIFSNDDDDMNVTNKVFKLLPRAFLRSFVTALWLCLLLILVLIAHYLLGLLLYTISGSTNEYFLKLAMLPWFISACFLCVIFEFSQTIAVLEPAHYGRDALHRSAKMVRVGGAGTILVVFFWGASLSVTIMYLNLQLQTMQPGWSMYYFGVIYAVAISFLNFVVYVVHVVMYFVYTSRLDAAVSSLPKFAASSSLVHPYKPLAAENPPVGEPRVSTIFKLRV